MITSYNRIAGQSVERLAALSDGIFGVAMTLLAIRTLRPLAGSSRLPHEFSYLGNFLGWPAISAQSPTPFRCPPDGFTWHSCLPVRLPLVAHWFSADFINGSLLKIIVS